MTQPQKKRGPSRGPRVQRKTQQPNATPRRVAIQQDPWLQAAELVTQVRRLNLDYPDHCLGDLDTPCPYVFSDSGGEPLACADDVTAIILFFEYLDRLRARWMIDRASMAAAARINARRKALKVVKGRDK